MSLIGLLKSRIDVYRLPTGAAASNRLGEPSKTAVLWKSSVRASFAHPRISFDKDTGAGDRPTGMGVLIVPDGTGLMINDVLTFVKGTNIGTWWAVDGFPYEVERMSHIEVFIKPHVGKIPI